MNKLSSGAIKAAIHVHKALGPVVEKSAIYG